MFLEGFYKAPAGMFVDSSILIELLPFRIIEKTDGRDKFHINLNALTGIEHLFIRLRDILGIGRFRGQLSKFDPKDDETGMRITSAHIGNEFNFIWGMLIGMVVRAPGKVTKRIDRAIEAFSPAIDVLTVSFVLDGSLRDAVFLGELKKG